ncbi:hypothetical protein HanRHA438_Chr09g0410381 [Helianthus annuus]|nr:hypothetical protein HanIR_Chr09g0429471 [Helianthus annuus]KAJ0889207.1 hypothetical protein HanRHA438_Chr09g0410381 [Helianthus annuus]
MLSPTVLILTTLSKSGPSFSTKRETTVVPLTSQGIKTSSEIERRVSRSLDFDFPPYSASKTIVSTLSLEALFSSWTQKEPYTFV